MAKKGADGTVYHRSGRGYSREAVRTVHQPVVSGDPSALRRANSEVNRAWESRRSIHPKK
jgi:hypothetical protein